MASILKKPLNIYTYIHTYHIILMYVSNHDVECVFFFLMAIFEV